MLFKENIEPSCSYCKNGSRISEEEVACTKKGIVSSGGHCRRFVYDPLRREPAKPLSLRTDDLSVDSFRL